MSHTVTAEFEELPVFEGLELGIGGQQEVVSFNQLFGGVACLLYTSDAADDL